MQGSKTALPADIEQRPEPEHDSLQLLHRHCTERTRNTPGGFLMDKYKVVYITHYTNDCYISTTTDKDLSLEDAMNLATTMNKHLWKFHQNKENHPIYTVRKMI